MATYTQSAELKGALTKNTAWNKVQYRYDFVGHGATALAASDKLVITDPQLLGCRILGTAIEYNNRQQDVKTTTKLLRGSTQQGANLVVDSLAGSAAIPSPLAGPEFAPGDKLEVTIDAGVTGTANKAVTVVVECARRID